MDQELHRVQPINKQPLQQLSQPIKVRCPECRKLYSIELSSVHSANPVFECIACKAQFSFSRDQNPLGGFATARIVRAAELDEIPLRKPEMQGIFRVCPQCAQRNPRGRTECMHCGIIFEKAELVQAHKDTKTTPALVRTYKDLLKDYENWSKHLSFVDQCEELQALPFALKKYQQLKKAQPNDQIAKKMWESIGFRMVNSAVSKSVSKTVSKTVAQAQSQYPGFFTFWGDVYGQIPWLRLRKLSPLIVSAGFIVIGMSSSGLRNLVGMGAAILFLFIGITWFIKGKLRVEDFW